MPPDWQKERLPGKGEPAWRRRAVQQRRSSWWVDLFDVLSGLGFLLDLASLLFSVFG